MELIRLLSKYQQNIYPYNGGYYEQPSKFVEAMNLIDNLLSEHKAEQESALKKARR